MVPAHRSLGTRLSIRTLATIALLYRASCCFAYAGGPDQTLAVQHWRDSLECGVSSCYAFLNLSGIRVSFASVQGAVPVIPEKGSALGDMAKACRHLGFNVELLRARPAGFDHTPLPAIAHVILPPRGLADAGSIPRAPGCLRTGSADRRP